MSNKFEIQVVALDGFSKIFRGLNNSAAKAVRPLTNIQRQTSVLFREMHLPQVAKGFQVASGAAAKLAESLGSAAAPLTSLLGIGAAGSIVGGLAAVGAITYKWAEAGGQLSRVSKLISVSTDDLQRWSGAARLAGLSGDTMVQTLSILGRTLQDAKYGRDPIAMNWFNSNGVNTMDPSKAMLQIADAMKRLDAPGRRTLANDVLHIDESTITLLAQGSEGIRKLMVQVERLGGVQGKDAIDNANALKTALAGLGIATEGAANRTAGTNGFTDRVNAAARAFSPEPWGDTMMDVGRALTAPWERRLLKRGLNAMRYASVLGDPGSGGAVGAGGERMTPDSFLNDMTQGANFSSAQVRERAIAAMRSGSAQLVEVHVTVDGPPGTTVTAKSSGGVKVVHSMPSGAAP